VTEQLQFILAAVPTISDFSGMVEDNTNAIQAICGFDDSAKLVSVAETAEIQLCGIAEVLKSIIIFFQCRNWYPLYEATVHDAMCYSGTDGFAWVASTQFVVVFMAVVIVTFRAVFYEIEVSEDEDKIQASVTLDKSYDTAEEEIYTPKHSRQSPKMVCGATGDVIELTYQ
jgi:hypothetical protein